nr:CorA family divalent cation transporter [Streptomyces cyaneochromogenes]
MTLSLVDYRTAPGPGAAAPPGSAIYGMNFKHMPRPSWSFGYPFAVGLMGVVCISLYVISSGGTGCRPNQAGPDSSRKRRMSTGWECAWRRRLWSSPNAPGTRGRPLLRHTSKRFFQ